MMMTGMRSQVARTPLISPSRAPNAMPMPAAIHGSMPKTMAWAAMTALKLNIQPIDRSMSRMTTTKTMPMASIPMKAAPESCWKRVAGLRKFGWRTPTTTTSVTSATSTPVSSGRRGRVRRTDRPGSGSDADVPAVTGLLGGREGVSDRSSYGTGTSIY